MTYTITKEEMAKLLGRSLSDSETENYDLLLASAKSRLEAEVNSRIDSDDKEISRKYIANRGFRQLFVDPFSNLTSAKIDGVVQSDVMEMNNDDLNASWFNSVKFAKRMCGHLVEVEAVWGYGSDLPGDLKLVWAQLFGAVSATSLDNRDENGRLLSDISSESILSHSVSYGNSGAVDDFTKIFAKNAQIIAKYRKPDNFRIDITDDFTRAELYDF